MNIQLDENYKIISDPLNYILQEKRIAEKGKNEGKEIWVNAGYHGTLQSALKGYIRKNIQNSDIDTVEGLIDRMNKLEETVKQVEVND